MKQKLQQPEFGKDENDPFANDLLNRKQEIMELTPMIRNITSPATMALDAKWGAGKTAFIKMWAAYLNKGKEEKTAFYFNAWETDFAADPLVPFVEKITEQMPEEKHWKLKESAKALIPAIVGDITRRIVGDDTAEIAETATQDIFTHHSKLYEFKTALGEFAKVQTDKHIVIFVDELDRCRPDYAVKVLERIKHLFEAPGLVFVLATNREQLCHSINALYGAKFDADTYLRRFIEFDFTLKQPNMKSFIGSRIYSLGIDEFLMGRAKISTLQHDCQNLCDTLMSLARIYNSSLRDAEQLLMRIVFVLKTLEDDANNKYEFYPGLLAFLVMARLKMPEHYRKYILPADNGEEMIECWENQLQVAGIYEIYESDKESTAASYITAHIIAAKPFAEKYAFDASGFIKFYENKRDNATSRGEKEYCDDVIRRSKDVNIMYRNRINLAYLVKKIEMLDKFRFPDDDNAKGGGS